MDYGSLYYSVMKCSLSFAFKENSVLFEYRYLVNLLLCLVSPSRGVSMLQAAFYQSEEVSRYVKSVCHFYRSLANVSSPNGQKSFIIKIKYYR